MRKLIIVFLLFCNSTFASFDMNDNIQKSYFHIINLEFERANDLLDREELHNPENGFILLHRNYIDFLTILITEDINYFQLNKHFKNERLSLLDKNDEASPYYLYSQAEIMLQWAFSRLKFGEYIVAANEIIRAYKLLQENQDRFPDFTLNKKGLGIIHTFLGAVPKELSWIVNLAGFKGGVILGLSELDSLLNDQRFEIYEYEVLFLLSFLQINLGNNKYVCQQYLDRIGYRYQDNLLLNFAAARLSHNLGDNNYCLDVLKDRPDSIGDIPFHYLEYLEGMAYFYMLDFKNAQQRFENYLDNFRGLNYIKSANHKLAWIAFLQNDIEMKEKYFSRVVSEGNILIDEDKVAFKDAQLDRISHPMLLRSRLLYDGGYYSLALSELDQIGSPHYFSSRSNQAEYWYRLARVNSKLEGSENLILEYYKEVLSIGKNSSSYYAPMSALQIGLIYEKNNDFHQARHYFNKCLSMSGFDYKRGIHQRAKAALSRISD